MLTSAICMHLSFSDCDLDVERRILRRAGCVVHVEPQVFSLLVALAAAKGRVLDRDAIIDAVWNGRIVSDSAISARVHAARQAVGDDGRAQNVIRTVTGVGFQLAQTVRSGGQETVELEVPAIEQDVHMTKSLDGTGLAWASSGASHDGQPALLRGGHWLTHLELDLKNHVWAPLLAHLNQGRRLLRYDVRGTGLSTRNVSDLSLDRFVEDMLVVLQASGEQQVDIVAASQNVPVSIAFAVRYPERVRRIVLLSGFLRGADRRRDSAPSMTDAFLALLHNGWGDSGSPFMQSFYAFYMPESTRAERESLAEIQFASASAEMAVAYRRAIASFDVTDLASLVDVPVLIVHAQKDAVNPLSEAQDIATHIPDSQLMMLDSANHIPLPRDPEWARALEHITRFLSD